MSENPQLPERRFVMRRFAEVGASYYVASTYEKSPIGDALMRGGTWQLREAERWTADTTPHLLDARFEPVDMFSLSIEDAGMLREHAYCLRRIGIRYLKQLWRLRNDLLPIDIAVAVEVCLRDLKLWPSAGSMKCQCRSSDAEGIAETDAAPTEPGPEPKEIVNTNSTPILFDIRDELERADAKHGRGEGLPDCWRGSTRTANVAAMHGVQPAWLAQRNYEAAIVAGILTNAHILTEEVAEAIEAAANGDDASLERELIQVGAVAVKWIREIRRRRAEGETRES